MENMINNCTSVADYVKHAQKTTLKKAKEKTLSKLVTTGVFKEKDSSESSVPYPLRRNGSFFLQRPAEGAKLHELTCNQLFQDLNYQKEEKQHGHERTDHS